MADSYDSSESDDSYYTAESGDEETETAEEIYKQIDLDLKTVELNMSEREAKTLKCERCVSKPMYESVAVFLCFFCEVYLCVNCMCAHESHEGMKVWRKETERQKERQGEGSERKENKKQELPKQLKAIKKVENDRKGEREETDREGEQCEKMLANFVSKLMNENRIERRNELKKSHSIVCDRVKVKHQLDRMNCWITGLCGLENKRVVVCDYWNSCIKIFKLESHVIQRYIRFVGSWDSRPQDVTEIDLKQNSSGPNLVSRCSSDISVTDRADPDKKCLIAVTLPGKRQIMFIDLSKKPAKPQKIIKTAKCFSIQFYDNKIFTACDEGPDSLFFVYIYSTDGDMLNKFDTGIYGDFIFGPCLAVVSGRVYLTNWHNNKVQCRNIEGQVISEITIEGSRLRGISVDPDNNVYVCAQWHGKVYKLDADLTQYKSVLDETSAYIRIPRALCYYRDMLFIGHAEMPPSFRNFVTVVRLL